MNAWCIRLKRGEARRDLALRADFLLLVAGLELFVSGLFFGLELSEMDAGRLGAVSGAEEVCAATAHTNAPAISATNENLRNPTTSF
jgi:hypothetical protein